MTAADTSANSHSGEQRIFLLDALRGFALFGILLGNIKAFSGLYLLSAEQLDLIAGGGHWNESIHFWSQVLVKAKFYSLFSLLFGIGVALQWQQTKPQDLRRRHSARMLVLMVIGLLHSVLLWAGDILLLYALLGLTLIWFVDAQPTKLLGWALALLLSPALLYTLLLVCDARHPLASILAGSGTTDEVLLAQLQSAGYREIFVLNAKYMVLRWVDIIMTLRIPRVLGMFLLGVWLVRSRVMYWLIEPKHRLGLLMIALSCLGGGLILNVEYIRYYDQNLYLPASLTGLRETMLSIVAVPTLMSGYIALIALVYQLVSLRWLEAAGRLPLTNYLLQTIILIAIFYDYGLGYIGSLDYLETTLLASALFLLQMTGSVLFLKYFQVGPFEILWRRSAAAMARLSDGAQRAA